MMAPKKYVVVLAHADGWGALSANKLIQYLQSAYPELGIHLIVSKATRNATTGRIVTAKGMDDLRPVRDLKETDMLRYFEEIDKHPLAASSQPDHLLTFKQLAEKYCDDHQVHYTTRGGLLGGEEAAAFIEQFERQHGQRAEVLLSVDTMAILPKRIQERNKCFSTHPGPLDNIKVEGMQGTLRQLVYGLYYDALENSIAHTNVKELYAGKAYVKGSLFLQHAELDKGPTIIPKIIEVSPAMSAYEIRDTVYKGLIHDMCALLPQLLDPLAQELTGRVASDRKTWLERNGVQKMPELQEEAFKVWQGVQLKLPDGRTVQNQIVDPDYFKAQMRRYFPGSGEAFEKIYNDTFGATLAQIKAQREARALDHPPCSWEQYVLGDGPNILRTARQKALSFAPSVAG